MQLHEALADQLTDIVVNAVSSCGLCKKARNDVYSTCDLKFLVQWLM